MPLNLLLFKSYIIKPNLLGAFMTQEELDALMAGGLDDELDNTKEDAGQEVADVKGDTDEVTEVAEAIDTKDEPQSKSESNSKNAKIIELVQMAFGHHHHQRKITKWFISLMT